MDIPDYDSILPAYEPTSGPGSISLTASSLSLDNGPSSGVPTSPSSTLNSNNSESFLQIEHHESFTYVYNLFAGKTHLQIFILVESEPGKPHHYDFSVSMKVGHVERAVSKPVQMRLSIDPRKLEFVVFVFPPRTSLPVGCLYNLRVWLRTATVDHRLVGEKDLWFGKDPDFNGIADASYAHLRTATENMLIYQGAVGRAQVSFIIRWKLVEHGIYALSLDYEAGGAGKTLFEDYHLRLYCEPQTVSFLIYTIPVSSTPPGASHRLRIWLRTPHVTSRALFTSASPTSPTSSETSYIYQRLWKSDDFKIGARLGFESVGTKIIIARRANDDGESRLMPLTPNRRPVPWMGPNAGVDDGVESVYDR